MQRNESTTTYSYVNEQDLSHIALAIEGIRYGSIEITIHDSRIVQIERKEKLRFDRER
ncbi:YezD family protein [Nitrospira sp. Nam80]